MFAIQSVEEEDINLFNCFELGCYPVSFSEAQSLNWSLVGVFEQGGLSDENVVIHRNKICGKVLQVCGYLITCPINILREK